MIRETLSDRLVAWLNPTAGIERAKSRMMLDAARGHAGGYESGRRDRRAIRNWRPGEGSANADTNLDLPDLRGRSRDLVRNAPIASGAIGTVVTNVVGEGLTLAPAVDRELLGIDDDEAKAFETAAAREWRLWTERCDFTRTLCFEEMQALALRSVLESGDLFVARRYRRDAGDSYGTKIQLIEADRCLNQSRGADKPGMIGGVAYDGDGAPTGYWISNRHPGDAMIFGGALQWTLVPARDAEGDRQMLHLYEQLRPDQARGVPFLAPVIQKLKELADYTDAEARAAVVTAMLTVFVTSKTGEDEQPIIGDVPKSSGSANEVELGAGAIIDLEPGESPQIVNPLRPNPEFDAFVMSVLRQIGVGLELPYEILIKHFTASYSASRAALETAWQFFRKRRRWLDRRFCQPCYEWVLTEAVAEGRLTAPGFFTDPLMRRAWCNARWRGPARISLDQSKDATADGMNLENGLVSKEQVIQERFGGSWDETLAQRRDEKADENEAGLTPLPPAPLAPMGGAVPPAAPPAPAVAPAEPAKDNGGDDTEGEDKA